MLNLDDKRINQNPLFISQSRKNILLDNIRNKYVQWSTIYLPIYIILVYLSNNNGQTFQLIIKKRRNLSTFED